MTEDKEASNVILASDFSHPPSEVADYRAGERVERSNFVSFLVKSFAISKGEPKMQYVYFRWLEDAVGFKWRQSFSNLLEAGGWKCLSGEEKHKFVEAYKNVGKHKYDSSDFLNNPQTVFQLQITAFANPDKIGGLIAKRYSNLESVYKKFKDKFGIPRTGTEFVRVLNDFGNKIEE